MVCRCNFDIYEAKTVPGKAPMNCLLMHYIYNALSDRNGQQQKLDNEKSSHKLVTFVLFFFGWIHGAAKVFLGCYTDSWGAQIGARGADRKKFMEFCWFTNEHRIAYWISFCCVSSSTLAVGICLPRCECEMFQFLFVYRKMPSRIQTGWTHTHTHTLHIPLVGLLTFSHMNWSRSVSLFSLCWFSCCTLEYHLMDVMRVGHCLRYSILLDFDMFIISIGRFVVWHVTRAYLYLFGQYPNSNVQRHHVIAS